MESYIKFSNYWRQYTLAWKNDELEGGKTTSDFVLNIANGMATSKLFHLQDDVKRLLAMTTPPNKNDHFKLPFPSIFLNADFTKEELQKLGWDIKEDLHGVLVSEGNMYYGGEEAGEDLRISICRQNGGRVNFDTQVKNWNLYEDYKDLDVKLTNESTNYNHKMNKFVHHFVINFLNLLQDPDIELIDILENKEQNAKRAKKGKIPIPGRTSVRLTGTKKEYISTLITGKTFQYGHKFWVRGHWRTLKDERYGDNVGKRTWIMPFIKGKGILINKDYEVEK